MKKIIAFITLAILTMNTSWAQNKDSVKLNQLYKEIKIYKEQPQYWIFIHSNNCSYTAAINGMPIYTNFNDGSMKSLSAPLNPLLLSSGTYALQISLFPKQDEKFNTASKIEKNSSLQVRISRTLNKGEKTVLADTISVKEDNVSYFEKTYHLDIEVPYALTGWSKSVNLKTEDEARLKKEVAAFYEKMMHLYQTKDVATISEVYYPRQLENAQALYSSTKEDTDKLTTKLETEVNRTQNFKLENYKLQFYANGTVVGLVRTDGEFLGKSAFLGLTDESFFIYSLLLHRPKPGAPLEVIR